MNIPIDNIQVRFFDNIYRRTIENTQRFERYEIERGRKILDNEADCELYLVLYGGKHYHKLRVAFEATLFSYLHGKNVEIIDWGCGIATASCVLIDHLIENRICANIEKITLIDPSIAATQKGIEYLCQMFQNNAQTRDIIHIINKNIDDITTDDLVTDTENIKVHLFSNIIDVETFKLEYLHKLIIDSFTGINRLICTSPNNNTMIRLDAFQALFENSCEIQNPISAHGSLHREIFMFKPWEFQFSYIGRYEKQFTIDLPSCLKGNDE